MYRYIRGMLVEKDAECLIVEVHGIGYQIEIAPGLYEKLPVSNSEIFLHITFVIREFSQKLYGFLEKGERDLFEHLLDISGVGPKLALNIVGKLGYHGLQDALITKNVQRLCSVPGIGKKTAERLLLELKGVSLSPASPYTIESKHPKHIQDAISALINLGYSSQASLNAVTKTCAEAPDLIDVGALITKSLQSL